MAQDIQMTIVSRRRALAFIAVTLGSVALNIGLVAWLLIEPYRRRTLASTLASRLHQSGPTILLGDSILEGLSAPPTGTYNLAVSGATVGFTRDRILPSVVSMEPSRVVIGIGVNDLRYGSTPADLAADVTKLANTISGLPWKPTVIVLAILPVSRRTKLVGAASNANIQQTNALIHRNSMKSDWRFINHSGLFVVGSALNDQLSSDGLHLNAAGQAELARFLFGGIARSEIQ